MRDDHEAALLRLAARLPASTQEHVRGLLLVREDKLAVEWVADALADRRLPASPDERNELLVLASAVDARDHVVEALQRTPMR